MILPTDSLGFQKYNYIGLESHSKALIYSLNFWICQEKCLSLERWGKSQKTSQRGSHYFGFLSLPPVVSQ